MVGVALLTPAYTYLKRYQRLKGAVSIVVKGVRSYGNILVESGCVGGSHPRKVSIGGAYPKLFAGRLLKDPVYIVVLSGHVRAACARTRPKAKKQEFGRVRPETYCHVKP